MSRKRTYSIVAVPHDSASCDIDVTEGYSRADLDKRLAVKPAEVDYLVFSGSRVVWQPVTTITLGAPRKARAKRSDAGKPRKAVNEDVS